MEKIVLFDPSLQDNKGAKSANLGDIIIYESVIHFLRNIFPTHEILRISTHVEIEKKEKCFLRDSTYIFVGGTNLLSSEVNKYNQWKSSYTNKYLRVPIANNAILIGVGWWQYQHEMNLLTKLFYRRLLNNKIYHSVRDDYTRIKLLNAGINNAFNTSCPTIWGLNGISGDRAKKNEKEPDVLLTLTDYHPNPAVDNEVIKILLEEFSGYIYFFPQGNGDLDYLKSLSRYKQNNFRFKLLPYSIQEFYNLIANNNNLLYIGTRLHGGIKCIQEGIPSLILANDNRAEEIKRSANLPVVSIIDKNNIKRWIEFESNFGEITLPMDHIELWKNQF